MGLAVLWRVESSWTRDQTHVPCIGRWILIHCATREVPKQHVLIAAKNWPEWVYQHLLTIKFFLLVFFLSMLQLIFHAQSFVLSSDSFPEINSIFNLRLLSLRRIFYCDKKIKLTILTISKSTCSWVLLCVFISSCNQYPKLFILQKGCIKPIRQHHSCPWHLPLYFVSMDLITLGTSWKWNYTEFVFFMTGLFHLE